MLEIKDVTLKIKENVVFKHINLKLSSQNILIVKGNNGSGKTSFLKTISGLIDPTSGEIMCADHDIKNYPEDYFYDYSYLTTDEIFNHDFSIQYYLNFWAKLSKSNESLKSVIHYFELENLLNLKIKQISSGWKKRLLLSKLMIENRLLWFLDEPFNFLDEKGCDSLINMINSRRLSGGIVILTSNQKIDHFKDAIYLNIDEYK